jgi:Fe2+ or Zn2+ uptake regulation protein
MVAMTREQASSLIRDKQLRRTNSRVATLLHLAGTGKPVCHREVAEALAPGGHEKSTVFRCLNDLSAVGLVNRTEAGHLWLFEVSSGLEH